MPKQDRVLDVAEDAVAEPPFTPLERVFIEVMIAAITNKLRRRFAKDDDHEADDERQQGDVIRRDGTGA